MPRKGPAPKRPLPVDPVYGSPLVTQLVSKILVDGKKTIAQGIVYTALDGTRTKTGVDPVYQSPLVTQLVNKILLDGKKSVAESIVYGALEGARDKTGGDP